MVLANFIKQNKNATPTIINMQIARSGLCRDLLKNTRSSLKMKLKLLPELEVMSEGLCILATEYYLLNVLLNLDLLISYLPIIF